MSKVLDMSNDSTNLMTTVENAPRNDPALDPLWRIETLPTIRRRLSTVFAIYFTITIILICNSAGNSVAGV